MRYDSTHFVCLYQHRKEKCEMTGPAVTVTVDRLLGRYHPEHPDICCPINYGYIKGTTAAAGEENDGRTLPCTE